MGGPLTNTGERRTPGNVPQNILDLVNRSRRASQQHQLDIVHDQRNDLQDSSCSAR